MVLIHVYILGLPKPAIINQFKAIGLANVLQQFSLTENDILYIVTPLYHMAASTLGWWNTMKVGTYFVVCKVLIVFVL